MSRGKRSLMTNAQATAFGENVKALREDAGLNISELAELIEVNPTYLGKIEKAASKASPEFAQKIADGLGTTVDNLMVSRTERHLKRMKEYGVALVRKRIGHGMEIDYVASALGISRKIYLEYERGAAYPTQRERAVLERLFEEKPAESPAERKPERREELIPSDIVEIILKHVKDIKVSEDKQKEIYRFFSKVRTENEERMLWG